MVARYVLSLRAACLPAWHIRFRTIQSIIITLASAKGSYYYISYCKERGAGNKGNNPCRPNCHNHPPLTLYYSMCVCALSLPHSHSAAPAQRYARGAIHLPCKFYFSRQLSALSHSPPNARIPAPQRLSAARFWSVSVLQLKKSRIEVKKLRATYSTQWMYVK